MGISSSLPLTATIKMTDIWMIFTIMYPFTGVVLQSYIQVTLFEPLSNVVTLPQSRKYHIDLDLRKSADSDVVTVTASFKNDKKR